MFTMKIWHEKISHFDEFYILSIQLSLSLYLSLFHSLFFSLKHYNRSNYISPDARQVLTDCVKIGYKLILKNEIQIILRWYLSFI